MKTLLISLIVGQFFITNCVSIERDIYFKNKISTDEKNIGATRPGTYFRSSPIEVENSYKREITMNIQNYSDGSYFWGFVIPILPVFFLPQMKFSLNSNELLKVNCVVGVNFGPEYLQKYEGTMPFSRNDMYVLNKKGLELSEKVEKTNPERCTKVQIILKNGQILNPIIDTDSKKLPFGFERNSFTFPIVAATLSEFKVTVTEITLNNDDILKTNREFDVILEDWTRYYMPRIAP